MTDDKSVPVDKRAQDTLGASTPTRPELFHELVLRVLGEHRRDATLDDRRLMMILLGEMHAFVQRSDIREKAIAAVANRRIGDGLFSSDDIVDVVVKAVMEDN